MPRSPKSNRRRKTIPLEDLDKLWKHVEYEIFMLHWAARAIRTQPKGLLQNAIIDSFLVHARNLDEFCYSSFLGGDKVSPQHFDPQWPRPIDGIVIPKHSRKLTDAILEINARTTHLLLDRVDADPDREWPVETIVEEIDKVLTVFYQRCGRQWNYETLQRRLENPRTLSNWTSATTSSPAEIFTSADSETDAQPLPIKDGAEG
jgi:hypothetical protein